MHSIVIADDRPLWMQREDRHYTCRTFCRQYRRCSTRVGYDCARFGGDVIPRLREIAR